MIISGGKAMETIIICVIFILIISIIIYTSYHFSNVVTKPITMTSEETYKRELENNNIQKDKWEKLYKEEVTIKSPYGYDIHGLYFPQSNSNKAIIFSHGITWSLFGSVKYMDMFLKRGFSVFIYDHRNHGKSGGSDTSFGFYEKYDLKACADWLFNKIGKNTSIGVHGESMGAATVLQYAAIDSRIKFCIEDCGYSDAVQLFKHRLLREYKIKWFPIVKLASIMTKIRFGWKFQEVSPIKGLSSLDLPILFIHGDKDDYVPTHMCLDMYNAKKGVKYKYIASNSGHAQSYVNNKVEYEEKVNKFLKDINIIE